MKKLAVVVGHTKDDKGAFSPFLKKSEYDWNGDLAAEMIKVPGIDVQVFWRDGVGISGAYAAGEQWGADAFVELHFNSSHNSTSTGTGVLYQSPVSKQLAIRVSLGIQAVLGLGYWPQGSNGVCTPYQASGKQERGKKSLTASKKPSVLIESFFGSNPNDCRMADACRADLAMAIVSSVISFFEN